MNWGSGITEQDRVLWYLRIDKIRRASLARLARQAHVDSLYKHHALEELGGFHIPRHRRLPNVVLTPVVPEKTEVDVTRCVL